MKIVSRKLLNCSTFAVLSAICSGAMATNLISDPGFEAGGLGWVFSPSSGVTGCGEGPEVGITNSPLPVSGSYSAYKNCRNNGTGTISQEVSTIAGHDYFVQFWVASYGSISGRVDVSFGATTG